jgi:hypothetical protein
MDPEEEKGSGQKGNHECVCPEEGRVSLPVTEVGVSLVLNEPGVKSAVTSSAIIDEVAWVNGRSRIILGKNIVRRMAIGASGDPCGVTDILDLAVIGHFIKMNRRCGKTISLHHFFIAVTFDACAVVKLTGLVGVQVSGCVIYASVMESVAIGTGCRILIARRHADSVTRMGVFLVCVTLGAAVEDGFFQGPFYFFNFMNVPVTVIALKILMEVVVVVFEFL